jgi:hypothetical protein
VFPPPARGTITQPARGFGRFINDGSLSTGGFGRFMNDGFIDPPRTPAK